MAVSVSTTGTHAPARPHGRARPHPVRWHPAPSGDPTRRQSPRNAASIAATSSFRICSIAACAALGGLPVAVVQQTNDRTRRDLPRHAEAVDEPSAPALPAAVGGQRRPQPVGRLLVRGRHRDGGRGREGVVRAAVENHVRRAGQGELDDEGGTIGRRTLDAFDGAARQEGDVEPRRFLALAVEPQARANARVGRHRDLSCRQPSQR